MLIPWTRVHHLLDDVHQSFFSPSPSLFLMSNREGFSPLHPRWHDEGDVASLSLSVPGLSDDNITITLDGDILTIEGHAEDAVPEGFEVLRKERVVGNFKHEFSLASDWDPKTIKAVLREGILKVSMEKAAKETPRQIPISTSTTEVQHG